MTIDPDEYEDEEEAALAASERHERETDEQLGIPPAPQKVNRPGRRPEEPKNPTARLMQEYRQRLGRWEARQAAYEAWRLAYRDWLRLRHQTIYEHNRRQTARWVGPGEHHDFIERQLARLRAYINTSCSRPSTAADATETCPSISSIAPHEDRRADSPGAEPA